MRKLLIAGLTLIAFTGTAGAAQRTTLLTPSGQPVRGPWQRWIDHSWAPTYHGTEVLSIEARQQCSVELAARYVLACTGSFENTAGVSPAFASDPETAIDTRNWQGTSAAFHRYVLMYEHGHVIDDYYLTDQLRAELLAMWDQPPLPANETMDQYWWSGEANRNASVYGEWFSEGYSLCSLYRAWDRADYWNAWDAGRSNSYGTHYPGWGSSARAIRIQSETCTLIRALTAPRPVPLN